MRSETLVHQRPVTPPNLHSDLHSGLHHVAQYVADRNHSIDDLQQHGSAYGSPAPMIHNGYPHQGHAYQTPHSEGHLGDSFSLDPHYDGYSQSSSYYQEDQYHGMPNTQSMIGGSPLTPRSAIDDEEYERRIRSNRHMVMRTPPQPAKPKPKAIPKSKKAKAARGEKPKTPKLTAPLSVLTKDMVDIPVKNMEEWVNRPVELRRREVEKRNGYVTRPMNSFMLYRSAYAERTKQWCTQNNHQVVSSISGESWPMEPPEVRELYNEYAKIERINHQKAHPNYKFSPSKAAAPARKRKGEYSDDESDFEDGEGAPGGRSRARSTKRQDQNSIYSAAALDADFFDPYGKNGHGLHRSSWDMNAGRQLQMPMQGDVYYYPPPKQTTMGMQAMMEDPCLGALDSHNGLSFSFGPGMLGLPGGNTADMMQHLHSGVGTPLDDGQVDPMLLAFDGTRQAGMEPGMQSDFKTDHIEANMDRLLGSQPTHEGYHAEQWQADPTLAPVEQGSEFEKWMEDRHGS